MATVGGSKSQFSRVYPPGERILFDGGKNSKYDRTTLADNESPDCKNVIVDNGSVKTRFGTRKLNTATVGSLVANGIYTRHDNTGAESMVVFYGQHMYSLNGTSFVTVPSGQSVFTAGTRVGATEYENYLFIGQGSQIDPYKYNSHLTRHGIPAPTVTATASSFATGILTGQYVYAVTYVNSAVVEGNISPYTTTITFASATGKLTSVPVAPASFGVNARRIYRTDSTGVLSTLKRVATIADNTTTTYTDTTADAGLGTTAPTDNGVPPKYRTAIVHQNRIFCDDPANPNFIWYSDLANPYVFESTNFVRVGDNTNDIVKGIDIYDNSLVIRCDVSIYILYMPSTTPTEWRLVKLRSSHGSKSPYGAFEYNNKIMFPAVQSDKFVGFSAISGDTIDPSATFLTVSVAGSDLKSDVIEPDIFDVQEPYLGNISAITFKNKGYVSVTSALGNTTNNTIFTYDFTLSRLNRKQEGAWLPWTGIHAEQFTIYLGKLYCQESGSTGFVHEMNVENVYNDNGTAINSYYWTKEFSGCAGDENIVKDFRYAGILFENSGDYYMNLNYRVDSDDSDGNSVQIDLTPGGGTWGFIWGIGVWGGGKLQTEIRQFLGQLRGKRIQFKFSNQNAANQAFGIIGMNFVYNKKGLR